MDGQAGKNHILECQLISLVFIHSLNTSTMNGAPLQEGDLVVVCPQDWEGPGVAGDVDRPPWPCPGHRLEASIRIREKAACG